MQLHHPGPDELVLKLNTAGICFSDVHFMMNDWALPKMSAFGVRSAGHEGAGHVVKVGANVKGWKVGDRAGIKPIWNVCQSCELCTNDSEAYCSKAVFTGLAHVCHAFFLSVMCHLYEGPSADTSTDAPFLIQTGSWQEYVATPADYTPRIPDGVDDFIAAPLMCSATTMYRSIVEAELSPGSWACFPGGAGGVGIQGVQLAKAMGLRPIVIDAGADKQNLAVRMGAEAFIDFRETKDVVAAVVKIADGVGVHAVFVTAPQAYDTAVDLVGSRVGAKVMCVGLRKCFLGNDYQSPDSKTSTGRQRCRGSYTREVRVQTFYRQRDTGRNHQRHGESLGLCKTGNSIFHLTLRPLTWAM
jgi:propanol-preferring alcohol dehydrogenase